MSLKTLTERFEEVNRIKENNKKIDKAVFNIEDVGDLLTSYKNLKEIEKSHKEENGKLRVEFEKVYEDNLSLAKELEQEKEKTPESVRKQFETYQNRICELEEKLKIATAMLTKGTYPEKNEGDNDFDKQFIAVDKIKEIVDECIEKKANVITGKEEYCFNTNDNSFLAHKIVELLEEK